MFKSIHSILFLIDQEKKIGLFKKEENLIENLLLRLLVVMKFQSMLLLLLIFTWLINKWVGLLG